MGQRADQQVPVTERVAKGGLQFLQVRGCHSLLCGAGVGDGAGVASSQEWGPGVAGLAAAGAAPPFNFTALFRSWAATALIDGCRSGVAFSLSSVASA